MLSVLYAFFYFHQYPLTRARPPGFRGTCCSWECYVSIETRMVKTPPRTAWRCSTLLGNLHAWLSSRNKHTTRDGIILVAMIDRSQCLVITVDATLASLGRNSDLWELSLWRWLLHSACIKRSPSIYLAWNFVRDPRCNYSQWEVFPLVNFLTFVKTPCT